MITEALNHIRGIGPVRLSQLQNAGIRSWQDAIARPELLPKSLATDVVDESQRCLEALENDDIQYFVEHLFPPDRWRILHRYAERCSFFDIETTGLEYDDTLTVIVCLHKGQLHTFVEHENLDDFLDLLDEIELLVSFNGSTFDVPRVLDGFHIPELPCPHFDLRWPCFHQNLSGGLKQVTSGLGIQRPADLDDADGGLAVQLWHQWLNNKDEDARRQLIRYCAADVLLLKPLAEHVGGHEVRVGDDFWRQLPDAPASVGLNSANQQRKQFLANMFGSASPTRLRTRRRA